MVDTEILKVDPDSPEPEKIRQAAQIIREGKVVAIPTDTVYGLAVDGLNKKAVERLSRIKKRPENKPFSLLISGTEMLEALEVEILPLAEKCMDIFWPGALTIILESTNGDKIGLRFPRNMIARELIRQCNAPLACPSANFSGETPCVSAQEVKEEFSGIIDLIVDGGRVKIGKESSVIDLTVNPPHILREGAIPKEKLLSLLL